MQSNEQRDHLRGGSMLSRQKVQFSEVFYVRHRQHVVRVLRRLAILLIVSGVAAGVSWMAISRGEGHVAVTSLLTAIFLYLSWETMSIGNLFRVRILPYFERRLGSSADTWDAGESLLWHSRCLDTTAARSVSARCQSSHRVMI